MRGAAEQNNQLALFVEQDRATMRLTQFRLTRFATFCQTRFATVAMVVLTGARKVAIWGFRKRLGALWC